MQNNKYQPSVKKTLTGYLLFGVGILVALSSTMFIAIFFILLNSLSEDSGVVFWGVFSIISISFAIWCLVYSQKLLNPKSSPYHPSQPILHMGHAWVKDNDTLTEYSDAEFNSIDGVLVLNADNSKTIIQFSKIKKIYTDNNLNIPAIYLDTLEGKLLTLYFVDKPESIQTLTSNTYKIKRLVLGEVLTNVTTPVSTVKTAYSQIVRDYITIIERWLRYHKISAYKNVLHRNTRTVLGAILVSLSVIGLLYLYIYFTDK